MKVMLLLLCLPSLAAADKKMHPWAKFPLGAWVKIEAGTETIKLVTHSTLAAVTDKDYVLRDQTSGFSTRDEKRTHPFAELAPASDPTATKGASESLTVAGKTYACTVWTWAGQSSTGPATVKEWRAPGVALPLKQVVAHTLMGLTQIDEIVAAKLDEPVKTAGTTFKTVRYQGTSTVGKSPPIPFTRWSSLEIPGGVVKETRFRNGAPFSNSTVLGFGSK